MKILIRWIINTLIILLVGQIVSGVHVAGIITAIIVALILGVLNVTLKPILVILTLPLNIITLGLFTFVINALILLLVAALVPGFVISGLIPALIASIIISLIHFITKRVGL